MDPHRPKFYTIDDYISVFPEPVQKKLLLIRRTIRQAAPQAEEAISYQIPTFKLQGNLIHFAAHKHHIGLYPGSSGIAAYKNELSAYKISKGAVQIPLDSDLPL